MRMTHSLEVSQISRTIARALLLNEDLTEAIALGHDLGHTPFGHAGERALELLYPGFSHTNQSLRVVDVLENDGKGLNLTFEVRDGIFFHSGEEGVPATLEGWVVRISDRIAYINHDIDDAIRAGLIQASSLPRSASNVLGISHSQRINSMVVDIIKTSNGRPVIEMSAKCSEAMDALREFLFENVYFRPQSILEENKIRVMVKDFYDYYLAHSEQLPVEYTRNGEGISRAVCDYIAGMTDSFAFQEHKRLFS